jgi:hypothetical protein
MVNNTEETADIDMEQSNVTETEPPVAVKSKKSRSPKRLKAKNVPKKIHKGKVDGELVTKSSARSKTKMARSKTVFNKVQF